MAHEIASTAHGCETCVPALRLALLASGLALWLFHHAVLVEKDLMRVPIDEMVVRGS